MSCYTFVVSHTCIHTTPTYPRHLKTAVKVPHYAVDAAILKVLSRRCTCLEYHPRNNNLVLCGDKKGLVAVCVFLGWGFEYARVFVCVCVLCSVSCVCCMYMCTCVYNVHMHVLDLLHNISSFSHPTLPHKPYTTLHTLIHRYGIMSRCMNALYTPPFMIAWSTH